MLTVSFKIIPMLTVSFKIIPMLDKHSIVHDAHKTCQQIQKDYTDIVKEPNENPAFKKLFTALSRCP